MSSESLEWAFWAAIALVVFTYAAYPPILWVLASGAGRDFPTPDCTDEKNLPSVSLLIAAHNEESVIAARLENALDLDYPDDRLEIVVASDGSEDATGPLVQSFANKRVRLLDYKQRRGKAGVLNTAFQELSGDVVVLSDANTNTDRHAVRNLVRWFQYPNVGVVCGRLVLTDPKTGLNVDSMYWKYETFLKQCEGKLNALLGANGGIYAVRRRWFTPIDPNTIIDDFVLPLRMRLKTGCAIVYDSEAIAHEETPPHLGNEFARRCRIGAGDFQSLPMLWKLLNPRHGWIAFTFLSHKVLRWLCPFLLVTIFFLNVLLLENPLYRATLILQIAMYGMAAIGSIMAGAGIVARSLRLTTLFVTVNLALLVGFWRWILSRQSGIWERTAR